MKHEVVHTRVTAADKRAIMLAATRRRVSLTAYVRDACLSPVVLALDPDALKALASGAGDAIRDAVTKEAR